MTKEQCLQNPHKKAVFLVHTTFDFDIGLGFGKLQTDFDDFYRNFTDRSDTAGDELDNKK